MTKAGHHRPNETLHLTANNLPYASFLGFAPASGGGCA